MTTCGWPACRKSFRGRKGQRYCGRRCSGRANANKPRPGSKPRDTYERDLVLKTLRAGPLSERELAVALYGDDSRDSRNALGVLMKRATEGHYFERQGVHVVTSKTYTLVQGHRLKEVSL